MKKIQILAISLLLCVGVFAQDNKEVKNNKHSFGVGLGTMTTSSTFQFMKSRCWNTNRFK